MLMGNLILGYSTQTYGENSAATDCAAFSTADFPPVSWEEVTTELAVVSLANSLSAVCSESGSISMADTSSRSSSHASRREVRVKFCCLSLWKRMLYSQRARVAPTAWTKGCIILKEQIPELTLKGKHYMKTSFGHLSTKKDINVLMYSPSHVEFGDGF